MGVIAIKDYIGSTSAFYQVEDGMIFKSLHPAFAERDGYKVVVEKKILERLGEHPRIVKYVGARTRIAISQINCPRYIGFRDGPDLRGLLLIETSHGNLQNYIDQNNDSICPSTRKKWCRQVTEGLQYVHSKDVIHSDLRPENCLLHKPHLSLDILLCDFGGSTCRALGVDGRGLPDPPFWDLVWESTTGTDIFSLGSIFYTIVTGHWPYKSDNLPEEDKWQYEGRVIAMLEQGMYPQVEGISGGTIMMGCWQKLYSTAEDVLRAQDASDSGIVMQRNLAG
jgi:serine/threonine protein kinase